MKHVNTLLAPLLCGKIILSQSWRHDTPFGLSGSGAHEFRASLFLALLTLATPFPPLCVHSQSGDLSSTQTSFLLKFKIPFYELLL